MELKVTPDEIEVIRQLASRDILIRVMSDMLEVTPEETASLLKEIRDGDKTDIYVEEYVKLKTEKAIE